MYSRLGGSRMSNVQQLNIHRQWSRAVAGTCITVGAGVAALTVAWSASPSLQFFAGVIAVLLFELLMLYRIIITHSSERTASNTEQFTLASWLTILRGAMLPLLGGFILIEPTGTFIWAPAVLFAVAAGLDLVDGAVARATETVTDLGGKLDGGTDGIVVLVGSIAAVSQHAAPLLFLLVGCALYIFNTGKWYRRYHDRPVYELPQSQLRRVLGATIMALIFISLLPIVPTEYTRIAALVFMIPFLLNFTRDWLTVSGRISA